MTVAELISKLQRLSNHNLRVVVSGYEGGYCDINEFKEVKLTLNVNNEWYYGPHEDQSWQREEYDEIAIQIT